MKAYVISDGEYCTIEFAAHRATAQSAGANELDTEFQYVTCRRAPEFDKYAEQRKVPWKVLIEEHGWAQECGFCYRRVYSDEPGRVYENDQAFCSVSCREKAEERAVKYGLNKDAGK